MKGPVKTYGGTRLRSMIRGRSLEGRVVVVTGTTAGIGRATAQLLVSSGATVIAAARDGAALDRLSAETSGIVPQRCDISDERDRAALVSTALSHFGRVDAVVSNVGVGWTGLVEDMSSTRYGRWWRPTSSAPSTSSGSCCRTCSPAATVTSC